jgi:hypothetical protein
MGSVAWPTSTQIEALRLASEMCVEALPVVWGVTDDLDRGSPVGKATVTVVLEAYAAAALTVPIAG